MTERPPRQPASPDAERFAEILSIARLGTWEYDLATGALAWSPELRALLGLPADAPADGDLFLARCADDGERARLQGSMARVLDGSAETYALTYRVRWDDGTVHVVHASGRVRLGADGSPQTVVGVLQDVTDQEALREQLQWSQHLETVGQLAAGLAHDLNNLLTVVQSSAGFLRDTLGDHPVRADIDTIREACARAATLTHGLLAFTRRQVLQPERTDVNQLLGALRQSLARVVGDRIVLDLRTPTVLGTVMVDPEQLTRVLLALAANARDAMPTGGTFTLETAEAQLPGQEDGAPHVRIRARDTGVGLDAQALSQAFVPYRGADGASAGLGLAAVFGIVTQSGGMVRASSVPRGGSTFDVYLPVGDRSAVRRPAAARTDLPGARSVLLVDDDGSVRRVLARVLERVGHRVVAVGSLEEALEASTAMGSLEVLVTDVMLGASSGREVADAVRAAWPQARVLFVSGYAGDPRIDNRGPRAGDAFLAKPFAAEELERAVAALFAR
jgi:two-component system cell cycle sensor histidine kinase/response regulator CckA